MVDPQPTSSSFSSNSNNALPSAADAKAAIEAMQALATDQFCLYCGRAKHVNPSGGFMLCPRIARLEVDPVSGRPTAYEFFPEEDETRGRDS